MLFTVLVELPELDADCLGGASGLATTLLNAGGFFVPLLILSPLVAAGIQEAFTRAFLVTALSLGGS